MSQTEQVVYVVDDDEAVRKSIYYLLTAKGYPVREFASGEDFLASAALQRCGCVVLDLRLGGMSGLQVFDALRTGGSPLVTVFLSGHGDISLAVDATKKGAYGWLEKPCKDSLLRDTIALAMREAEGAYKAYSLKAEQRKLWQTLTPREQQVAWQIRTGAPNKRIAQVLSIDVRTVETHRAKVYYKLGLSNTTELDHLMRDVEIPPLDELAGH